MWVGSGAGGWVRGRESGRGRYVQAGVRGGGGGGGGGARRCGGEEERGDWGGMVRGGEVGWVVEGWGGGERGGGWQGGGGTLHEEWVVEQKGPGVGR